MIGIIDILLNDVAVSARVLTRVYPMEREQSAPLPAITVEVTDVDPNGTKDGVSTLDEEFVSVTSYAKTYAECLLLAADCRAALDRYSGINKGVAIQECVYVNEFQNKANINNKKIYLIEQNYKIRIVRIDTYIAPSASIVNSDATYSATANAGETLILPDITITKNDDTTVTYPASKDLDIGIIDPVSIPSTWDELVSLIGRGYNYPQQTGLETIYRTGDDADVEQTIFAPVRAANSLKAQNGLDDFVTLFNVNSFGNNNRFTDINGLQLYNDNYIIDNYTGIGWYINPNIDVVWNDAIDNASSIVQNGFSDWFIPNANILNSIVLNSFGFITNYNPFNILPNHVASNIIGTSTSANDQSSRVHFSTVATGFRSISKTSSSNYQYICRKHF